MNLKRLGGAVERLSDIVDQLAVSFPAPAMTRHGTEIVERHAPSVRSDGLACYLKAVKICSTLNGAVALLDQNYVQEAYALCRIAEDQVDDLHFLLVRRGENGGMSALQERALAEFFQEEFEDPTRPVDTSQERDRIPRQKIRAVVNSDPGISDPSGAQAISRMLYRAFSGYVHGAYVHIMELHSDTPGHYHMHGTPNRIAEAVWFVPNYAYRAMLAVESLVKFSGREDLLPRVMALRTEFAAAFDLLPAKGSKGAKGDK